MEAKSIRGYNGGGQSSMVILYDPAETEEKIKKLREKYKNGNIWDKALAILQVPGVTWGERCKAARAITVQELAAYGNITDIYFICFDNRISMSM